MAARTAAAVGALPVKVDTTSTAVSLAIDSIFDKAFALIVRILASAGYTLSQLLLLHAAYLMLGPDHH